MPETLSPLVNVGDLIAVTGATGYVGGRLVPALLEASYRVRCLVREPRKLDSRPWRHDPRVEVIAGDLADTAAVARSLQGCRAAYYLVHSMVATGGTYADRDRELAAGFAAAARDAGIARIIYLGGLGEMGPDLSEHLRSRRQVEQELASCGVPVTTFRAAMIIGSGSASFETALRDARRRRPHRLRPLRAPPTQGGQLGWPGARAEVHTPGCQRRRRTLAV
jgi:uncharacterized protein YbjT (DUF2867 family)